MLSRVANSVYWINRYIERAENYARYVSVNFNLALDLPPQMANNWMPLLIATADDEEFCRLYDQASPDNVLYFVSFDERNYNSILACVMAARENARTIRETISREMWESLNQFYWKVKDAAIWAKGWDTGQYQLFFGEVKTYTQLFFGIIDSTISRNEGWHFGRLGKLLERADKTTRFLDVSHFTLVSNVEKNNPSLALLLNTSVLKSVSAYNMFRQQHNAITPSNIMEFLIFEANFPRSVRYCIRQAELSLYEISGRDTQKGPSNLAERTLSKLSSEIIFTDIADINQQGLHQFLDTFQQKNNEVGAAIQKTYFDLKTVLQAPTYTMSQQQ
jgi:uncharacterized alpha-E superfamily protein